MNRRGETPDWDVPAIPKPTVNTAFEKAVYWHNNAGKNVLAAKEDKNIVSLLYAEQEYAYHNGYYSAFCTHKLKDVDALKVVLEKEQEQLISINPRQSSNTKRALYMFSMQN